MTSYEIEDIKSAALIMAGAARCMARMFGMNAENLKRERLGQAPAYDGDDFMNLASEEGIDANQTIARLSR